MSQDEFCRYVLSEGQRLYRDLPWRGIDDAYGVLVSEVMLQQTQVKRVLGRWERWMGMFPSPDALAAAAPADVLAEWQGLGYNRRALALKRAAEECSQRFGGRLPETVEQLQELPGIGPATAAGVTSFARNLPAIYIETNVRTVFIHTLFPDCEAVSDNQQAAGGGLLSRSGPGSPVVLRAVGCWCGSEVAGGKRLAAQRALHASVGVRGSRRQKRACLVRIVLACPGIAVRQAAVRLDAEERAARKEAVDPQLFAGICADLEREGFFRQEDGRLFP